MYAIIEAGGRQWKVEPGTHLKINRIATEVGGQLTVERVLLAQDGSQLEIGKPYVAGAKVVCEVLAHLLGPKVISYHFRRRENWRKTVGHRQPLTQLVVKSITAGAIAAGEAPAKAKAAPKAAKPSAKAEAAEAPRVAKAARTSTVKKAPARLSTSKPIPSRRKPAE